MTHEMIKERLEDDARLAVRQVGLAYLALWALTWWMLGHGGAVLGRGGACRLETLSDLFLWSCAPDARLGVVADLANGILASTVWAPAVVMSAAVQPEVRLAAFAVIGLHLVGLPAALLLAIRFGARLCDRIARRPRAGTLAPGTADGAPAVVLSSPRDLRPATARLTTRPPVTPRTTFGLRQAIPR